jgi:two-component system sensor histidine kinase KdpD
VFDQRLRRVALSLVGVTLLTFTAHRLVPVNATTAGFAYLLLILFVASTWGFVEACLSSVLATLFFNFFFLPPIGTFTIADPQNWVALFSFLTTSLVASRLSAKAKLRALEAIEKQRNLEHLYSLSRAILLIDRAAPFPAQLVQKMVEIFGFTAATLYDRRSGEFHRAGASELGAIEQELKQAVRPESPFSRVSGGCVLLSVRLGSEPIASIALRGAETSASVLQGVANLIAIGLERARAEDLAQQVEAARQSEQLRATLIDAMAHEFKTPLTLIKAATTSLLASPDVPTESRREQLTIADEEAEHLRELIDDALEMARLDTAHIELHPEMASLEDTLQDVLGSMQTEVEEHPVRISCDGPLPPIAFDKRLMKLAIRQLLGNALKYTSPETPVEMIAEIKDGRLSVEVKDYGKGIPAEEQQRIFERFYRSPSVKRQIPGSGLGLSIAHGIVQAHSGELTVESRPGQTTFRITLPIVGKEVA